MNKLQKSQISLGQLAQWAKATPSLSDFFSKRKIGHIWMDSRKVKKGDVFLALKSDTDDGHRYVMKALQTGAISSIIDQNRLGEFPERVHKKMIAVKNPLRAAQVMAREYLKQLDIPVIAVTGSSGKTTTRKCLTTVLEQEFSVGKTEGNWNNHIGVPLSVLRLNGKEDIAIFELGANHTKEIDTLSRIVKPDVGIITNIGYAHVGLFKNLSGTTDAKFEIINGMHKKEGLLLLNGDDPRLVAKNRLTQGEALFFGTSKKCGIRAEQIRVMKNGSTSFQVKGYTYTLTIPGRHFIYAVLPAIFIAKQLGISEENIAKALYALQPAPMRGTVVKKGGFTFIVDCYNANPSSMRAAIDLLVDVSPKQRRCAIVGDMLELGTFTTRLHKQLGKELAQAGIQKLIAVGELGDLIAKGAIQNGMKGKQIHSVPTSTEASSLAHSILRDGDVVLLKGSRGVALESVFNSFKDK